MRQNLNVAKVVFGDLRSIGQNECINHFGKLCNVDRFLAIGSRHDFVFFKDAADSIVRDFMGNLLAAWVILMDSRFMGPRL
jgi:hypothetical protein